MENFLTRRVILTVLILVFFAPLSAKAIGLVTSPIEIKNALKGKVYQDEMIIVNSDKTIEDLEFVAEGAIAPWTKFYNPGDLTAATTTQTISPSGRINMVVQFSVPISTPNGTYKGSVGVIKKAGSKTVKNESVASMKQQIDREVTITVLDKEVINFNVSVIPKSYGLNPGEPLSIRFIYDNQSNVSIKPQIQIKIKKDDATVHNAIYPFPETVEPILPGSMIEIPKIEIPTTNLTNGKYLVEVDFLINGEIKAKQNKFTFILGNLSAYGAWYQPFMRWEFFLALGLVALIVSVINIMLARKKNSKAKKNNKNSIFTSRINLSNNTKRKTTEKNIE